MMTYLIRSVLMYVVIIVIWGESAWSRQIPSFIKICKRNDPNLQQCVFNTVDEMRPYLEKGIPEFGLQPIDPLFIKEIQVDNTGDGASINAKAKLSDIQVFGGLTFRPVKFDVDVDKGRMTFWLDFDYLNMKGQYTFNGKLSFLNITSTGEFQTNYTEPRVRVEAYGKQITKKGHQHLQFEKVDLKMTKKASFLYFADLFKGNELLTNNTNKFINENEEALAKDVDPVVSEAVGQLIGKIFNHVFELFTIDQLFPVE